MKKLLLLLALLPSFLFSQNSWVNVQLLTDDYPEETSWTITPPSGSPIIAQNDSLLEENTLSDKGNMFLSLIIKYLKSSTCSGTTCN